MCGVRLVAALGEYDQDASEDPHFEQANEAFKNGPVKPVAWRRIASPQSIAGGVDNAAHYPPVINPQFAVRPRNERRDRRHFSIEK